MSARKAALGDRELETAAIDLDAAVESAGFAIEHWNGLTDQASAFLQALLNQPTNLLSLQAFVPDFKRKVENLTRALADGRLRAIQGVGRAGTP